jgi:NAD-dependent deacetylase
MSSAVEPAATLPCEALRHGATVVEVNLDETLLTPRATFVLRGPAGEGLPGLVRDVWEEKSS